jgi:hypothetical protein
VANGLDKRKQLFFGKWSLGEIGFLRMKKFMVKKPIVYIEMTFALLRQKLAKRFCMLHIK